MDSMINDFIRRELISDAELLPLENDTPLLESGILDSLSLLRLLIYLEEVFHIAVDDFDIIPENFQTIDAICVYIHSRQRSQVD